MVGKLKIGCVLLVGGGVFNGCVAIGDRADGPDDQSTDASSGGSSSGGAPLDGDSSTGGYIIGVPLLGTGGDPNMGGGAGEGGLGGDGF